MQGADRPGAVRAGTEIVDAHAHLLDTRKLSYRWVDRRNPALTFLLPNYYDIARDFGPLEYRTAVADAGIARTVACEFGAVDPLAEARWVQQCRDETGVPDAFIAAVDLCSADLPALLARYADLSVVRAVRQPLYWSQNPLTRLGARPDYLTDPEWLHGFECVADSGLAWDLLVYAEQLPQALQVIDRFPHVQIVLEAAGWPLDRSPAGRARWRDQLSTVSERPNVTLKLQGLALIFGASRERIAPWLQAALDIFGPDRCMFATHLPVDGLLWTCRQLLSAVGHTIADLGPTARNSLLGGTADRVYLAG